MLPRLRLPRLAASLTAASALGALLLTGTAHAQVLVNSTVTNTGSLFNSSYSITNLLPADVSIINLNGLPQMDGAIFNQVAPDGFLFTFDPGVGIASFVPDSAAFTSGSTVGGFSFSSAFAPSTINFDALDSQGNAFNGTTQGPVAPVPEASTLVSLGAGLLLLTAFTAVRRRRMALARS